MQGDRPTPFKSVGVFILSHYVKQTNFNSFVALTFVIKEV